MLLYRQNCLEIFPVLGAVIGIDRSGGDIQFHLVVAHAIKLGRQNSTALDAGQTLALLGHFLAHLGDTFRKNKRGDGRLTQGVVTQIKQAFTQIDFGQRRARSSNLCNS